jgi:hypothetical protein
MVLCSEKPIKFGDQEGKFVKDFRYTDLIEIVMLLTNSLIKIDDKTGVPIIDGLNYEPICIYHILSRVTDLNLDSYKIDDTYKIVDDWSECSDENLQRIYIKVTEFYEAEKARVVDEINSKNSIGAHIRGLIEMLMGEDSKKSSGLIRKILTEFALQTLKDEKEPEVIAPKDFSEFKPKVK